jgi:Flp pilus assembly CpaF family ATPase
LRALGDRLTESQVESLIGTVAALLGTVLHGRAPIVEGELAIDGDRCGSVRIASSSESCVAGKPWPS